ncbi:glycosyltransferase [Synechococcus sp. ATX 2A4]|uniref:glycosyltransferase n=1 Tax=Synechococcus sp. ATX 2A4 TaxID=2823727 RepID=UPI0020CB71A8|nr:glycosyltransferase [Synechococcus sp. ATX 2A4]MCP9884159.1 glycosyltransferase [Synechococcus sp. ATX 2A4]
MKILHVNASDISGGAARAAYRIHRCLVDHGQPHGLQSQLRVLQKLSSDSSVIGGAAPSQRSRMWRRLAPRLRNWSYRGFVTTNPVLHSNAWLATGLGAELQARRHAQTTDLLHLHWLCDATLSVQEIGQLPQPLVWTLHDQWAFCGTEHYTHPPGAGESESSDRRFELGYTPDSRPKQERGPDLNRRCWLQKRRAWQRPMRIVCPSTWLANCARRSALMREWPITVIPNPIDVEAWAPCDQAQARILLGLPLDRPLVLFGAMGGTLDPRKGADLLRKSLRSLKAGASDTPLAELELVVFGQSLPAEPPELGFPIHYSGHLHDDISLRLFYAAADVFVIPSRQDNLPNTGLEAHACGTPVVAFRTGGLVDVVEDRITGYLAEPFDPASLAAAIAWVLEDPHRNRQLGDAARQRAEQLWNPERVAGMYAQQYRQALGSAVSA